MHIISEKPGDWKNLQDLVCKYLNEAGYFAESPKTIYTVRGAVEVDVYATAEDELLNRFICECKFWNHKVPKEKVHAFRTVVADSGSMLGILISKSGFQSGAIEAAYCSNVLLKDWEGFVELIQKQWLKKQVIKLNKKGALLHRTTCYYKLLDEEYLLQDDYQKLSKIGENCGQEILIARTFNKENIAMESIVINTNQMFTSCSELFEYLNNKMDSALAECEEIFKRYHKSINDFEKNLYLFPNNMTNDLIVN